MEQKRKSNFELLRIFAMLMIIAHHFAVHTQFVFPSSFTTINRTWIQFIAIGGKMGVNIFIMISGYFMVSSKMKWNKVVKLWSSLVFYTVAIYLVFVFMERAVFSWTNLAKAFFPVGIKNWWFPSVYLILYILTPFINQVLNSVSKAQLQKFLVVMIVLWSVLPTITGWSYEGSNLTWFMLMYCIGGYVRLHGLCEKIQSSKKWLLIAGASAFFTCGISIVYDYIVIKSDSVVNYAGKFYNMYMLPILMISVFLFMSFEKMKIEHSKMINAISATTFGIYLIHDEGNYMQNFLWNVVFKSVSFTTSKWFVIYSVVVICIVFCVCSIVELLRIYLAERNFMKLVDKMTQRFKRETGCR